jgi:translation initiation factor 1A
MPRSNLTGGKHHKRGKKKRTLPATASNNKVELAGENQVYALVKAKMGGTRLRVECSDGKERSASIPGKFFKKVWMNAGDIILCDLNVGSDDSFCYIVHKYTPKDANMLKSQGHITFDVLEDKEENNSFKFVDTNNLVPEQKRVLDLNNIDNSIDDSFDDEEEDQNKQNEKEEKEEDNNMDLDDL